MPTTEQLQSQLHEIQGNIIRGYRPWFAAYIFFEITDKTRAQQWLKELVHSNNGLKVTYSDRWESNNGNPSTPPYTLNIAFSYQGLQKLGLDETILRSFPDEFQVGMLARAVKILGDESNGNGEPKNWESNFKTGKIHGLLIISTFPDKEERAAAYQDKTQKKMEYLRAKLKKQRDESVSALKSNLGPSDSGIKLFPEEYGDRLWGPTEHFGYADGISQPFLEGTEDLYKNLDPTGRPLPPFAGQGTPVEKETWNEGDVNNPRPGELSNPKEFASGPNTAWKHIKPGEFLLGYEDEIGQVAQSPSHPDLRNNGTFLVFRKLRQNVPAFRKFLKDESNHMWAKAQDKDDKYYEELLAAKLMGRWKSGCPLELSPDEDNKTIAKNFEINNAFTYGQDPDGARCPLGSHIRRTNPRDQLLSAPADWEDDDKDRYHLNRHRIIRRGLTYGPELPDNPTKEQEKADRGIFFMALNASISRQFEFLQQQWVNKGEFLGLDESDRDPIIGKAYDEKKELPVPGAKVPFVKTPIPFVEERGGEYFFYPSRTALVGIADGTFEAPMKESNDLQDLRGKAQLFRQTLFNTVVGKVDEAINAEVLNPDLIAHIKKEPRRTEIHLKKELQGIVRAQLGFMVNRMTVPVKRGQHPKDSACVTAKFKVMDPPSKDFPIDLHVGVFKDPGKEFDALIRFSNGTTKDDTAFDAQGMAVKLFEIPGEKLLDDEKHAQTQDFLLTDHPVFFASTVRGVIEFAKAGEAMKQGDPRPIMALRDKLAGLRKPPGKIPLYRQYWSQTPYKLGNSYVKYFVKPTPSVVEIETGPPHAHYRRIGTGMHLAEQPAEFGFYIQRFVDDQQTPVNDPTQEWKPEVSPFIQIATITINPQNFNSEENRALSENSSFTPWHSLKDHEPAGEINLARKFVYLASSLFRHEANGVVREEPGGQDS